MREFRKRRFAAFRENWRLLLVGVAAAPALAMTAWYSDSRIWALIAAGGAGFIVAVLFFAWVIGGHASSLPWLWGAQGERHTAKEIEKLGPEWHCEHDIEHERGNWDHVLIGPPGVFLLDSKALHGEAVASDDALQAGRLRYRGGAMRGGARAVWRALEKRFSPTPFVQGVFVVWGSFPQKRHEENRVVYLHGGELVTWLLEQPTRLHAPRRAAVVTALREEREAIAAAS